MEVILLVGIQASGKSTFYKTRFADTHLRINLDMLKTRYRERRLFSLCLEIKQRCVVDNTNLTKQQRQVYLALASAAHIPVHGYYFATQRAEALARNTQRVAAVPDKAILGAARRLEIPDLSEGFTSLHTITIVDQQFQISEGILPDG